MYLVQKPLHLWFSMSSIQIGQPIKTFIHTSLQPTNIFLTLDVSLGFRGPFQFIHLLHREFNVWSLDTYQFKGRISVTSHICHRVLSQSAISSATVSESAPIAINFATSSLATIVVTFFNDFLHHILHSFILEAHTKVTSSRWWAII